MPSFTRRSTLLTATFLFASAALAGHVCTGTMTLNGADSNYKVTFNLDSHTSPPPDCQTGIGASCPDCPENILPPNCPAPCIGEKSVACWAPRSYDVFLTQSCKYLGSGICEHDTIPSEDPVWQYKTTTIVVPPRTPKVKLTYEDANQRLRVDYDYQVIPGILELYTDDNPSAAILSNDTHCHELSGTCYVSLTPVCGITHSYNAKIRVCPADPPVESKPVVVNGAFCFTPFDSTNCKPNDDTKGSCPICPDLCLGKPVNAGSGDVSLTIPLFTIAQSPAPLSFDLSYHSLAPAFGAAVTSPIGAGWTHPFNASLRLADPLLYPGRLLLVTAHGQRYYFDPASSSSPSLWFPIKPRGSGMKVVSSSGQYVLSFVDGSEMHFDITTGHWISTVDRWQNAISGTYNGSGQLTAVSDPVGRSATLTYDTSGRLASVGSGAGTWYLDYTGNELSGIRNPTTSGSWRTFDYTTDSNGTPRLLTAMRDSAGMLLEGHAYDATGRGTSSYVEGGHESYTFAYDTPAAGQTRVTLQVDAATTRVTTFTLIKQNGQYLPARVDGVCPSCGATSDSQTFTFDQLDHVSSMTDAAGHVTEYDVDGYGSVTVMREGVGTASERVKTSYNLYSVWPTFVSYETELSLFSGVHSIERKWTANETLLTTAETGQSQNLDGPAIYTSTASFDARHRLVGTDGPRIDEAADVTSLSYYSDTDPNPNLRGRLHTTTNAAGHVTTFEDYDVYGTARKVTDPNGVVTLLVTDSIGRVTSTTNQAVSGDSNEATDYVTGRTYDSRDRVIMTTSARGLRTRYGYQDGTDRLVDTIVLDDFGLERERKHRELDLIGEMIAERDELCATPANPCTTWTTKHEENYKYDSNGRLTEVTHGGATVAYRYDADGLLTGAEDENHAATDSSHASPNTTYEYDVLHRLQRVNQLLTGATGGSIHTDYSYDYQDNLVSVTDPNGNITRYAYDDFHRMTRQSSPVTGLTTYAYDPAGNLISTTDANGATTARTYDALGRVLSAVSSRDTSSETVSWTYDAASPYAMGRLATMTDPTGVTVYSYDRRGLLRSEQRTTGGDVFTTAYTYDEDANRNSMTYPTGRVVTYGFDWANRPLSVMTGSAAYVTDSTYLPFGPLSTITFGNGTKQTMSFDTRYRMTENKVTRVATNAVIADYVYQYDGNANVMQLHDTTDATYDRDFAYDDLNRLVTANTGSALWQTGSYTYDAMGNLLSRSLGKPAVDDGQILSGRRKARAMDGAVSGYVDRLFFDYQGTTPKLASVRTTDAPPDDGTLLARPPGRRAPAAFGITNEMKHTVQYDAAGNETEYFAKRTYSPRNLMASMVDGSVEGTPFSVTFGYDGRGVRVSQTKSPEPGSITRRFFYSPELHLLTMTADDGIGVWSRRPSIESLATPIYEYVWFANRPVAQDSNNYDPARTFLVTDHLGTPFLSTDVNGNVSWRAEYQPYGAIYTMRAGQPFGQFLRFPGQEAGFNWDGHDEYYNVFRWYRAGWGRYTQGDPIGLASGLNLFRYVDDNPLVYSDYLGLAKVDMHPALTPTIDKPIWQMCKAYSCTQFNTLAVDCKCVGCQGAWHMQISATLLPLMLLPNSLYDPGVNKFERRGHEQKHIADVTLGLQQKLSVYEDVKYNTKGKCDSACMMMQSSFGGFLQDAVKQSQCTLDHICP